MPMPRQKPPKPTTRPQDFAAADKLMGFKKPLKGYTWHHHKDTSTMQLIPTDLHHHVKHTGGMATKLDPNW
jgi:hypothetical protein